MLAWQADTSSCPQLGTEATEVLLVRRLHLQLRDQAMSLS